MEILILLFWIVVVAGVVGLIFWFAKSKNKKPVEKEIFSAPLDTPEEPKVQPEMPKQENEEAEEETDEEYKEE
jgi:flagellar basal body-associated protein FliL